MKKNNDWGSCIGLIVFCIVAFYLFGLIIRGI